jgi:methanogenic corrinoid protein MtbC1
MNTIGANALRRPAELAAHRELAAALRHRCETIAREVAAASRPAHPGEEALVRDFVDVLAAAVELNTVDGFARYARTTARELESRGVPRLLLDRTLARLRDRIAERLPTRELGLAVSCVDSARLEIEADRFGGRARGAPARPRPLSRPRREYAEAAAAGRRRSALEVVRRVLEDGHDWVDVYADVLAESLAEIGREPGQTPIPSDQRVAGSVTEYVLDSIYAELPRRQPTRGAAVVACAPGEAHQTGAHIVADALELDGWDVRFLGANVAARDVLETVGAGRASLVGLSATRLPEAAAAARVIAELHRRFGPRTPRVLVGGRVFREVPNLWRDAGADGFAPDVRAAAGAARGGA